MTSDLRPRPVAPEAKAPEIPSVEATVEAAWRRMDHPRDGRHGSRNVGDRIIDVF